DIAVGAPVANRNRHETEGLIGFFVNTVVMRGDLSGDPSFRELLGRAREMTLGALAHQAWPYEQVVAAVSPDRSVPLLRAMFNLQPSSAPAEELYLDTAMFDLTLGFEERDGGWSGWLEYDGELYDA